MNESANLNPGFKNAGTALSLKEKVTYGLGSGAEVIMSNTILILGYPVFYLGLGVRPEWIGLILLGSKCFDAVSDTVMGYFSDNCRFRWGRRKPFILLGALAAAVISFFMWRPPEMSKAGYSVFFLVMSILFYTFYTVFYVPYNALGYEMTQDYDERTRLMAYKWGIGAAFGVGVLPLLLPLSYLADPQNAAVGARFWAPAAAALFFLLSVGPSVVPKERTVHQEKIPFLTALSATLKNVPFLLICGVIILCLTGIIATLQLRQFLNMAYLFQMNQQTSVSLVKWFDYTYGITNMFFMFVVSHLAIRFDKKRVLLAGLLMMAVSSAASWFYITPQQPYLQLLLAVLLAPGMSGVWVLTNSCIADVCDYDQLQTGMRREGLYGAVFSFSMKFGCALGLGLAGLILSAVGFDKELPEQSPSTVAGLRAVFALTPAALFAIAAILMIKYPITKQSLQAVQEQLQKQRH